jgi:hypothetical protein
MRFRRPFAAGSVLGAVAHHGYETRAGVGLVFEPELGRRGALALWGTLFPLMLLGAARGGRLNERLSAVGAGIGAAGVAVHFTAWPWSLHHGVPMLDEAEGLAEEQLPAYNAVLWLWLLSSVVSLAREASPRSRRIGLLAGLLNYPILLASARHHFSWAREQARLEPERWSPALREQ